MKRKKTIGENAKSMLSRSGENYDIFFQILGGIITLIFSEQEGLQNDDVF